MLCAMHLPPCCITAEDSLVRVILPPQTVTGGVVQFEIARGHIESISIENNSDVTTQRIREILESSIEQQPSLREIDRNTRLAEEIPGVASVEPVLSPGHESGGTVVTVNVEPGKRFYGAAVIDDCRRQTGGLAQSGRDRRRQ